MEKLESPIDLKNTLLNIEVNYINRALLTTNGVIADAARLLGIKRTALTMRISTLNTQIIMPEKLKIDYAAKVIERKQKEHEYNVTVRKKRREEKKEREASKLLYKEQRENNRRELERQQEIARALKIARKKELAELIKAKEIDRINKAAVQEIPASPFVTGIEKPVLKTVTPIDTVKYEGWTNKDTCMLARVIDGMKDYHINKVVRIARDGYSENTKKRILNVLDNADCDVKLKLSNVNFEEIVKEYKNQRIYIERKYK